MTPDNSFLVSSARGDVLRLRQHSLSFLSKSQEDAVCFEPSLLAKSQVSNAKLSVSSDDSRFSWSLSPGDRAGASGSTTVLLLGHRGGKAVTGRAAEETASSAWKEWVGCDSIDLSTTDGSGSLQGDSLTLAIPAQHSLISFSQAPVGDEITVRADTPSPELLQVSVWHRVQNEEWIQRSSVFDLPAGGLRIPMPAFQGAIVVEGPNGGLEGLQFFGFRRLHDGDDADRAQLEKRYAKRRRKPTDDWPLWFRNYFLEPFQIFDSDEEVSAAKIVRKLRTEIRKTLLAPVFPDRISDWRPDLSIEDFTQMHRPELSKLIANGLDPATLLLASGVPDSPHLVRAARWAGNDGKHLKACLNLLEIETSARTTQQFLTPLCASWGTSQKLSSALDDVPASGTTTEATVRALYEELARTVAAEFQVSLQHLTHDHVQETLRNRVLEEFAKVFKIPANADGLPERLRHLASELEARIAPGLPELIDKGLEVGLLQRSLIDDATVRHARTLDDVKSILQSPSPLIDEHLRKRILQALSNPASTRSLICASRADAIRTIVTNRASELDAQSDRLLDLQTRDADFAEWLEYGIAQACEWTTKRALLEEETLLLEQLRLFLPEGMDPHSTSADAWVSGQAQSLVDQIGDFATAFVDPLTEAERRVLENTAAILRHVLSSSAEDGLSRLCDLQTLIRQGETNLTAIADRLMAEELPSNGRGNIAIRQFFRQRDYGLAKKVLQLSAIQILLSRHPSLPDRAWLDADEDFGNKMIQMYKALQSLDKLASADDVHLVLALWEQNKIRIDQRGGLAGVFQHWEDQLHSRIKMLQADLMASGLQPPSRLNIFKFIQSVESRSNNIPASRKRDVLVDGMEPEFLRAKLVKHRVIRPYMGR